MQDLYTKLAYRFLSHLTYTVSATDREEIARLGVTAAQANQIASLSLVELNTLSGMSDLVIIEIDEDLLKLAIEQSKQGVGAWTEEINLDVSLELLNALSALSSDEAHISKVEKKFGLSRTIVLELSKTTLIESIAISRTGIVWFDITANQEQLHRGLNYITSERAHQEKIHSLIRLDASWPCVRALTGMSKRQFQELRKIHQTPKRAGGAPRGLTVAEEHAVWAAWQNSASLEPIDRFLATSREAGEIPLRLLWPVLSRLLGYDEVKYSTHL